jgi:uncharacterized membrane protein YoaT (DUF817 family)
MHLNRTQLKRLILPALIFAACAAQICLLHRNQWLLTLLLLATTVLTLAWSWDWRRALASYVIAAVLGPCGEMMAVHHGAWSYPDPTCLGIPVYLPFGWGLIVVVVIWMSESVIVRPVSASCASNGGTER